MALQVQTPAAITRPLQQVSVHSEGQGDISIRDAEGREYQRFPAGGETRVLVGGSLGTHLVLQLDPQGRVLETATFRVDCETGIDEDSGRYGRLLDCLSDTLLTWWTGTDGSKYLRIGGKRYKYYVSWLRDHVHALKGMKYWDTDLKSGIDLYADHPREDGMIWDKCKEMHPSDLQSPRDLEFEYGDFIRKIPGHPRRRWQRIPVEADVEYLFIEGLYYTWKASGDDQWMKQKLDTAIRAVVYDTSDAYRWSEKYQLIKRGYTIDTWDFQTIDDTRRSGTIMRVLLDKTEFNIFYGDNIGMAVSCEYLAEMLDVAERSRDAGRFRELARQLRERTDRLCWNGEFYTHMIPENPGAERDLGNTPTDRQVTLSNSYVLNRRIPQDKCAAIIRTYQRLREEKPESAVAEWYNCYPPFEKGFRCPLWEYMNGGISTIVAGELAHGAFEHGFEDYGVDILQRLSELAERFGGYLPNTYKGKMPDPPPPARFTPLDIRPQANTDLRGDQGDGAIPWFGEPDNDMRGLPTGNRTFQETPFDVIDPAANSRRAVIGLSHESPYAPSCSVAVDGQAQSIYFLHTASAPNMHPRLNPVLIGTLRVYYADGTHATQYIESSRHVDFWYMPAPDFVQSKATRTGPFRMAWQGPNGKVQNVGMFVYGWENPEPDKTIDRIEMVPAENGARWMIAGITLSDQAVSFPQDILSKGIPDLWGASAVIYALIEGLAGIVDSSTAYKTARISPRWPAARVGRATACAKYPESDGYVRYEYEADQEEGTLRLLVTGNAETKEIAILLPEGKSPKQVTLDGKQFEEYTLETIEQSRYLCIPIQGVGVNDLRIEWQAS